MSALSGDSPMWTERHAAALSALINGDPPTDELLAGLILDAIGPDGLALVHRVCMEGNKKWAEKMGDTLYKKDKTGCEYFGIHYAAMQNNREVISYLIKAMGQNVYHIRGGEENTPFMVGIMHGHYIPELIGHGTLHAVDRAGRSSLQIAFHNGYREIARLLISKWELRHAEETDDVECANFIRGQFVDEDETTKDLFAFIEHSLTSTGSELHQFEMSVAHRIAVFKLKMSDTSEKLGLLRQHVTKKRGRE